MLEVIVIVLAVWTLIDGYGKMRAATLIGKKIDALEARIEELEQQLNDCPLDS